MGRPANDLTGQRFGRLLALCRAENTPQQKARWRCACDCGNEHVVAAAELRKGNSTSCGCFQKEQASRRVKTHGLSLHPGYAVWRSMLARCNVASHPAFKNYGGRGISVCPRWLEFGLFWADMGAAYAPGLELDRIDNDGGYSPDNCRWATRIENSRNRRDAVRVEHAGRKWPVADFAAHFGLKTTTIYYRLAHGWPSDKMALSADTKNRAK